jgi:hypothetical protein
MIYAASVPVFLRYLERLAGLVQTAQAHADARGIGAEELLGARLAPDMMPLAGQVQTAAGFALRASFPLAGRPVPADGGFAADFDGLLARIAHSAALLEGLPPAHFDAAASRIIEERAGEARLSLPAPEFLYQYALPNFFFHVGMVYAILRHRGVAVGKQHFDGFHAYPKERGAEPPFGTGHEDPRRRS